MAGYKKTVLDLEPVWFLTFDGDKTVPGVGAFVDPEVIDEIGNTKGLLHDEDDLFKGYYADMASLVQPEQNLQKAIRYGVNARNPQAIANGTSLCPCSFIEVPNENIEWDKDEFTLIWLMKKDRDPYANWWWVGEVNNSDQIYQLKETTMRFGNVFEMRVDHNRHTTSYSYIDFILDRENRSLYTATSNTSAHPLLDVKFSVPDVGSTRAAFCVMRYKDGVFQYIVDGRTIVEKDIKEAQNYDPALHTIPNWIKALKQGLQFDEMTYFIGGKPTGEIRKTSPKWQVVTRMEVDQISMFNKYISDSDLMRLYRRVWHRDIMYSIEDPFFYARMNDYPHELTDNRIAYKVNKYGGDIKINDPVQNLRTRILGKYLDEHGIFFPEKGFILPVLRSASYLSSIINLAEDFTLEFSIKGFASKRSAVFQTKAIDTLTELAMFANSDRGEYRSGWVDIRYADGKLISFKCDLMDDKWHRVIIRKKGQIIDVYVDETRYVKNFFTDIISSSHCTTSFLTSHDIDTKLSASISELIIYDKALPDIIMMAHTNFDFIYKVNGQIVSGGQPVKLLVRAYSHKTGELLAQTYSDPLTGNYNFYFNSNEYIDLLVLDDLHQTLKARAVSLIDPDTINETGVIIP